MADVNAPTDRTLSDSFKSPSSAVKEETSVSLSSFLSSPDQQPIRNLLPREAQGPAADTTTNKKEKEWRLKPKNLESNATSDKSEAHGPSNVPNPITTMRPTSPLSALPSNRPSASPHRSRNPYICPSPNRAFRSASPRMHSPASSQIFERSVQEDFAPAQASPSIPSHIMTENHIPPILGASSAALTDERLDPDSVEIVTHNFHQPAALSVTGGQPDHSISSSWHEDLNLPSHPPPDVEDPVSNYGNLDSADIRRLSFVSFADVVHGEQLETDHASNRDSMYMAGFSTNPASFAAAQNRSPSPVRSPVSSHGFRGRLPGSPRLCAHSPPPGTFGGELNVETMRQALRRTGSGDIGGVRSQPMSAVGNDDGTFERPFK
ncbi:hypothetical protein ACO22_04113 [Paracoccidioides brasiliensis]|uniref:Uncharacterized protein n=1 Tax=Paracoccidioides brasiliensis TaxID=121759 RepID=A0A1D2JE03_PARBR|nr:hypothetical protein ACO22_04113 [Paracoccidioides brasiliensis]